MSHIRKRVISLKKGVQDMSHLPKALLLTILAWAVGTILGSSLLLDLWALPVKTIRAEKEINF